MSVVTIVSSSALMAAGTLVGALLLTLLIGVAAGVVLDALRSGERRRDAWRVSRTSHGSARHGPPAPGR
jgi:hypothetical protein